MLECESGAFRTCTADADGCRIWSDYRDCPEGFCATTSLCGNCYNTCSAVGVTQCTGGMFRTCTADADGCLDWSDYRDCSQGFCANTISCGNCDNQCLTAGATECADGALRTCTADANGCLNWSAYSDCFDGFCADTSSCGVCNNECLEAELTECNENGVRTCLADEKGCLSWEILDTCPGLAAPASVIASDGAFVDHVNVEWEPVDGAESYIVYRRSYSQARFAVIGDTSSTSYTDDTAVPGTEYLYKVRTYNAAIGTSAYSEDDEGYRHISAPVEVNAIGGDDSYVNNCGEIKIIWEKVTGAQRYYIYRSLDDIDYSEVGDIDQTTFLDKTADIGVSYYYKIRAWNSLTEYSDFSIASIGGFTISKCCSMNVQASDGLYSDHIRITWDEIPYAERYQVSRLVNPDENHFVYVGLTTDTYFDDFDVPSPGIKRYYQITAIAAGGVSSCISGESGDLSGDAGDDGYVN